MKIFIKLYTFLFGYDKPDIGIKEFDIVKSSLFYSIKYARFPAYDCYVVYRDVVHNMC